MPDLVLASPSSRGVLLPPDRIQFSALAALLGISRSTLQRRYRPGTSDPAKHREWRDRLDIRQRRAAKRGAVRVVLHCSLAACEDLRSELLASDSEDLPAA